MIHVDQMKNKLEDLKMIVLLNIITQSYESYPKERHIPTVRKKTKFECNSFWFGINSMVANKYELVH